MHVHVALRGPGVRVSGHQVNSIYWDPFSRQVDFIFGSCLASWRLLSAESRRTFLFSLSYIPTLLFVLRRSFTGHP